MSESETVLERFTEYVRLGLATVVVSIVLICGGMIFVATLPLTLPFALIGYIADKVLIRLTDESFIEEDQ